MWNGRRTTSRGRGTSDGMYTMKRHTIQFREIWPLWMGVPEVEMKMVEDPYEESR